MTFRMCRKWPTYNYIDTKFLNKKTYFCVFRCVSVINSLGPPIVWPEMCISVRVLLLPLSLQHQKLVTNYQYVYIFCLRTFCAFAIWNARRVFFGGGEGGGLCLKIKRTFPEENKRADQNLETRKNVELIPTTAEKKWQKLRRHFKNTKKLQLEFPFSWVIFANLTRKHCIFCTFKHWLMKLF